LLELVARVVDPGTTLFIDDREGNLQRARRLGFHTQGYGSLDQATMLESGHILYPSFQEFRLNLNPPRKPRRCVPVPLWRL
jgi:FMN phosphatase YigB (HAD superfamily)